MREGFITLEVYLSKTNDLYSFIAPQKTWNFRKFRLWRRPTKHISNSENSISSSEDTATIADNNKIPCIYFSAEYTANGIGRHQHYYAKKLSR